MKAGDTIENAIWLNGTETPELLARYKGDVADAMIEVAQSQGAALTPLRWTEKRPGDERVPAVPDHIQGPDVRLLVAEADVVSMRAQDTGNFLAELEPRDLARLRRVTREAYARWCRENPGKGQREPLTDRQCDTLINDLGPEAALASLERGYATIQ